MEFTEIEKHDGYYEIITSLKNCDIPLFRLRAVLNSDGEWVSILKYYPGLGREIGRKNIHTNSHLKALRGSLQILHKLLIEEEKEIHNECLHIECPRIIKA